MFKLDNLEIDYEPYPIGIITPLIEDTLYQDLVASYPPLELFKFMPVFGNKYSLSDKWNPKQYKDFIANTPIWREFYRYVKSDAFIYSIIDTIKSHGIDLGISQNKQRLSARWLKMLGNVARGRLPMTNPSLYSRFEFSILPADGGIVMPHTDAPSKFITLVISIIGEGEWKQEYNGGTEVLKPKDVTKTYNYYNKQIAYDEVDTINAFPFEPNQAVIFVKTYNSLHGVRQMTGPKDVFRRTLTINLARLS